MMKMSEITWASVSQRNRVRHVHIPINRKNAPMDDFVFLIRSEP